MQINELHSGDPIIRSCSLNTLCDELYNPEKCFTAANRYHIVKRLANVLFQLDENEHKYSLERTILIFRLLAGYLDIALKIYEERKVLEMLYTLINDPQDCISLHAANALATLSSHQKSFYSLIVTKKYILFTPPLCICSCRRNGSRRSFS